MGQEKGRVAVLLESDDDLAMNAAGMLMLLLELEPPDPPADPRRDRVMLYQRLANAAIERDAVVRATPRPPVEILYERFDGARLDRELLEGGAAAIEAFLKRLSGEAS